MKNKTLPTLIALIIIYFVLKYFIPFGNYVIYPINLLVTFMHEFGHAFFALITWWSVVELKVNSDWSGVTTTRGGWRIFVLMWGYIGSALFWNILLKIWLQPTHNPSLWRRGKIKDFSEITLYMLSWVLILVSVFWFSSILSSIILFALAWWLIVLAKYTSYDKIILQFLWVASLLFIIEDFNVWPSSDLSEFSEIFVVIPQSIWMIVWLIIVVVISGLNLKSIFTNK